MKEWSPSDDLEGLGQCCLIGQCCQRAAVGAKPTKRAVAISRATDNLSAFVREDAKGKVIQEVAQVTHGAEVAG
jgi:hypothetical protein